MKRYFIFLLLANLFVLGIFEPAYGQNVSTKKERNLITAGNELYEKGNFKDALSKYKEALKENASSSVAQYNLGLTEIRIGSNPSDTTQAAQEMLQSGCSLMEKVARMGSEKPGLASKANYNLGNVAFNSEDYGKAIEFYKQALRLNPDDNNARRNLRIAQLKQQNQDNQDNQNDQNQDQDQQQEEQNNDQNQDQEQQQDQNNQDNSSQNNQQPQPQPGELNAQTAEQILNAMENKENQTRARVANEQGEKSNQRKRSRYNW